MPQIEVSNKTWERLKLWAVPLEDSGEDVIVKILAEAEAHRDCGHKGAVPTEEPQHAAPTDWSYAEDATLSRRQRYRDAIIRALYERGGQGTRRDVLNRVRALMEPFLRPEDEERNSSNFIRWEHNTDFYRNDLLQSGLIAPDLPRGMWGLSDEGRQYAAKHFARNG